MQKKAKMGRPRRKTPVEKLNLLVDAAAKRRAYKIATDRDMSLGRLFELVMERIDDGDPSKPLSLKPQ
jgi:hypothetical protein